MILRIDDVVVSRKAVGVGEGFWYGGMSDGRYKTIKTRRYILENGKG